MTQAMNPSSRSPAPAPEPPRIGEALAALREQHGLSLDELSRRAGVSKSMLSQIERAQANPTVAVVWRLANALGVPLAELLEAVPRSEAPAITTVAPHDTPRLRGRDPGCELRILGPLDLAGRFEWYELTLAPGAALHSQAHEPGTREHLTVQAGSIAVETGEASGEARVQLSVGETARYAADRPHALRNLGTEPAAALLVVIHSD